MENAISYAASGSANLFPQEVQINSRIIDVSAWVQVTQTFYPRTQDALTEARYHFPTPPNASVCAFKMRTATGYTVTGLVKKKRSDGRPENMASFRQMNNGSFSISLGEIPTCQRLTIELAYVVDLMDPDVVRQIRFTLPKAVMPDHDPLTLANTTDSGSPLKKLKIVLDISMGRTILRVFSTSHPETRMFQCYKNTGAPDPCHVRASYETTDPLTKDFVVTIRAEGLDNSRCFAQRHRAYGRTTMHLTLIPEFDIPIMRSQEYILLLDRSGSMSGSRIETAKRTVTSLLHALPSEGTIFNIFSFGSSYESLYGTSVQYNQQSLDTVKRSIQAMNANLGGTELQPALRQIFHSRSREHPTSVFVVTDGEVHDIQETTREVAEAVRAAEPSKPLRVFMLGIGEQASLDECKEIARAGNGLCLMALSADNILPNCMKLLRASSKFILKNVEIDWRIPARLMQDSEDIVIQVPHHIEAIYPDLRFVANAIITSEEYIIPDFVVIRGQRDGKGEVVEIRVPVIVIQEVVEGENPLIGTIAARRYMDDLRDSPRPGFRTHSRTRATVVQFGEQYQLESRYTSFVPIVRTIPPSKPKASWQGIRHQLDSKLTKLSKRMRNPNVARSETRGVAPLPSFSALQITADTEGGVELEADVWELSRDDDDYDGIESPVRNIEVTSRSPVAGPSRSAYADAGHLSLPDSSLWAVRSNTPQEHYFPAIPALMGTSTTKLASQPSDPGIHSVESPREEESSSPPRSPSEQLATPDIRLGRSRTEKWRSKMHWLRWKPFPMFPPSSGLHASVRDRSLATALPHIPAVLIYNAPDKPWVTVSEGVSDMEDGRNRAWELVDLQAFNGAFSPGNSFIEIIGEEAVRMGRESGFDEILWATALAVIYLERKLIDEAALQGSLEKAMRAGRLLCDSPRHFEIVLQRARGMRF